MDAALDPRFLPVGGGKGGIGKSFITAAIGSILAALNKKVVLFDADLGGANLHIFMGVTYPHLNLHDYLTGEKPDLGAVLIETPVDCAKLVSGASDILGIANPKFAQKEKLIRGLKKVDAEHVLLDLGAGTDFNTIDFFTLSPKGIVVINTELTTIENAYGFLKTSVLRKIQRIYAKEKSVADLIKRTSNPRDDQKIGRIPELIEHLSGTTPDNGSAGIEWLQAFRPRVILNRVKNKEDIDVADRFCDIARKYLGICPAYIGYIVEDEAVSSSIRHRVPLAAANPDCMAMACLRTITSNLLKLNEQEQEINGQH